ncbi:protein hairy-like [Mizuhopecten yessoensis]|uniref:Transcription factor HES-1 n=1 Tax=Mizuhopecten yessoensis TaxID=6573 RepID=A0A210R6U2_MIZYE|nr:protein hairy-like [Mizuhopecten yessoensis]OWF56769.1 Transcription factor HES-1 [Mizuhopecten yessoensis]
MSLQSMECGHTTKEKKASLRKSNKPVMEKKRRARINSCLSQLKTLVLEAMRKDSSQYSKLEKADILEMTVKHLRNLQRQQMSTALASDPNVVSKYRAGFKECAGEVVKYLNTSQSVNDDMRSRIMNHLSGVAPSVNAHPQSQQQHQQQQQQVTPVQITPVSQQKVVHPQPQHQTMQPLSVQIPTQQHAQNNSFSSNSSMSSFTTISSPVKQNTCLLMSGNVSQQQTNSQHVLNQSSPTFVNIATPVNTDNKTQLSGSFQILPGNLYNGPVAVYVGPVNDNQSSPSTTALPVFTVQVPCQQSTTSSPIKNKENVYSKDNHDYSLMSKQAQLLNMGHVDCHDSNVYNERLWRPW